MTERILALPRRALFDGDWPQGWITPGAHDLAPARVEELAQPVVRDAVEADPAWKQPIPYCLVTRGRDSVLCLRRRTAGSETRLHGQLSVGVGGHAHPEDRDDAGTFLWRALAREVQEELVIPAATVSRARFLGWINDDSTPVGSVHVGAAFWIDARDGAAVRVRETSKLEGGFESLVDSNPLWQDLQRFESWSRILLEAWRLPRPDAWQIGG